jgi:hypothetical protein
MVIVSVRAINFFDWILGGNGAIAIAFWPFIFVRDKKYINEVLINHERIHLRQQLELGVIPFYIWYLIAYFRVGYWNVSFEKEAYANEKDLNYLKKRSIFAFRRYL